MPKGRCARVPTMEHTDCNLCGSNRKQHVYARPDALFHPERWFDVVECRSCGLGFVDPRPTREEMGEYYPAEFFAYFDESDQQARYATEARLIERHAPAAGRLLDVGCAKGDFPRFMRARGWQVEGVEVAAAAGGDHDFPVHRGALTDLAGAEARFDVITAWAVLEHVHDPMSYFRKAAQLLRPGGHFLFLVTNFESLASRALFQEDIPRHLYFFTEATVREYLRHAGLELLEARYGDEIYAMNALNISKYALRRALGCELRWQDVPGSYRSQRLRAGRPDTLAGRIGYLARNPLSLLDHLLMPLITRWQAWRRSYGIVTFVACKPRSGPSAAKP